MSTVLQSSLTILFEAPFWIGLYERTDSGKYEVCKTILMIAHRLSTVRTADQIIVLENGRIVQRGNHEELMREDGLYRRFVGMRSQAIGWTLKGGKAHG